MLASRHDEAATETVRRRGDELTGWTPVLTLDHAIDDVIAHERGVIAPRLVEYAA